MHPFVNKKIRDPYRRYKKGKRSGGAEGARTPGLMTASHALSQLSYSPRDKEVYLTNTNDGVNIYFVQNLFANVRQSSPIPVDYGARRREAVDKCRVRK